MKPIKLTMSAFGPYAGKTEIEFGQLGGQAGAENSLRRLHRRREDYHI